MFYTTLKPPNQSVNTTTLEYWQREWMANALRGVAVRLHAASPSLRETELILRLIGVGRSFQAIFQWGSSTGQQCLQPAFVPENTALVQPTRTLCVLVTVKPKRAAVDETAVKINGEWSWLYAAIDLDTKLLLDVQLFKRHGTDPAAAFLHGVVEKHDCEDTVFLVDQFGYRTSLSRLGLSGRVDYTDRNLIEKWFHTLTMRVDRFHNSWVGSRLSVRQCLVLFVHYYNFQRPHQALDGRTPVEEVN
nr:IS6 family transposase [Halogeometricum pallidum]